MNRYALVIGSETHGLEGPAHDATRMAEVLKSRFDFQIDALVRGDATRKAILEAYDALIGKVTEHDAAVVYYAGHGAFAVNPVRDDRIRTMQAIIPFDHDPGSSDFRAITAWELSIKLKRLTDKTHNVTVIYDCCHAAQMSRDGAALQAVARALPHPIQVGFRQHLAALEAEYGPAPLDPVGNQHAVRLVACAQQESAYESPSPQRPEGRRVGVFTEALLEVLEQVGDAAISWASIGDAVRERVLQRFPLQRPDVEGPSERMPFALAPVRSDGTAPIKMIDGALHILSGQLLGTSNGDLYGVMPLGATNYDESRAIATLRVEAAAALTSKVTPLQWMNAHTTLPPDAVAIPIQVAARRRPVAVVASGDDRKVIVEQLTATRTLQLAEASETSPVATLRLTDGRLTIEDKVGPLFPATSYPDDLARTVQQIANLAVAQRIRGLVGHHGVTSSRLDITWGVVAQNEARPQPDQGAAVSLGDRIYVRVKNTSPEPCYVHIFNVGIDAEVALVTKAIGNTGYRLDSINPELLLGERNGQLLGLPLVWPQDLPRDRPRTDEIYVFVTTKPVSLQALETVPGTARGGATRAAGTPLQDLLAQLQDGMPRNIGALGPVEDYYAKRIAFELHPCDAAIADAREFQIDENPHHQATTRSASAWITGGDPRGADRGAQLTAAPDAVAIRLGELVIERNHAMFSAGIRIDSLVYTRSAGGPGAYIAQTMKFAGIKDGERLPFDKVRLFHGPVQDFVDICLWVSRDTKRERDLAALLAERAGKPELQHAATTLLATAGVAEPWIAAITAGAALARTAYDVILAIENESIGLYRTSFLTSERFGVGRHPTEGLYRAQDFSFSLLIEPITVSPAGEVSPAAP